MTISCQRKILEKQRRVVSDKIKSITAAIRDLDRPVITVSDFPAVCYDNRHNKEYYKNHKTLINSLIRKTTITPRGREEIINGVLRDKYYNNFYPGFCDVKFTLRSNRKPGASHNVFKLVNRGLYYLKVKKLPAVAKEYFTQAMAAEPGVHIYARGNERISKQLIYDYLSIAAEFQRELPQAIKYLADAIKEGEKYTVEYNLTKYQYIKLALLQAREKHYNIALQNLSHALNIRPYFNISINIFDMDEIIYWEQAKIFKQMNESKAAKASMNKLINSCILNFKDNDNLLPEDSLLVHLKNYRDSLRKSIARSKIRVDAMPPLEKPESISNYDSFQVNSKCSVYQNYVAKIKMKAKKNLRDYEYLIAFEFSKYLDKRMYEHATAPAKWRKNNPKYKQWVPGTQYFYIERDYAKAARVFDGGLKNYDGFLNYELASRAQLAMRNYKSAITVLTKGISRLQKDSGYNGWLSLTYSEQMKLYLFMRGFSYAKCNQAPLAMEDYAAGLQVNKDMPSNRPEKIHHMLLWERARLWFDLKNTKAAVNCLKKIKHNSTIREYIAALSVK